MNHIYLPNYGSSPPIVGEPLSLQSMNKVFSPFAHIQSFSPATWELEAEDWFWSKKKGPDDCPYEI